MTVVTVDLPDNLFHKFDDKIHEAKKKYPDISKAGVMRLLVRKYVNGEVEVK